MLHLDEMTAMSDKMRKMLLLFEYSLVAAASVRRPEDFILQRKPCRKLDHAQMKQQKRWKAYSINQVIEFRK